MSVLSREAILGVQDRVRELVEVPEWGGAVYVQSLGGTERDQFESWCVAQKNGKMTTVLPANFRARLVAISLVDDHGNRLFGDGEVELLGQKSARALDRVIEVVQRLNGIGAKELEEITKNSEAVPSDSSASD